MLKKSILNRIKAFSLAVFILVVSVFSSNYVSAAEPIQYGIDESTNKSYVTEYEKVFENNAFVFYADLEKGLFAVEDKSAGNIWYSTPNNSQLDKLTTGKLRMEIQSQIIVEYIYMSDEALTSATQRINSQSACVASNAVSVSTFENGIYVKYYFDELKCTIPVSYSVFDSYIEASIDVKNIDEGDKAYITAIHLLPSFGAGDWDDEGYLFVPDGCGALINFNNQVIPANTYDKLVYGSEYTTEIIQQSVKTQNITMPVFGIANANNAVFAVITEGDGAASVTVNNGNETCGYNTVSSKLNYRTISQRTMFKDDPKNHRDVYRTSSVHYSGDKYTVRYYFLSNEKANYLGMAETYRNYLINEKGLKRSAAEPDFNLDIYGAYDKKASFIGIPYTKIQPLTTFDQAKVILSDLQELGVNNISARYIGAGNYGIFNKKLPASVSLLKKLGGNRAFEDLKKYCDEQDISLCLDADLLKYRSSGNGIRKNNAVKSAFGEIIKQYWYRRSVYTVDPKTDPYYLLSPLHLQSATDSYIKSYLQYSLNTVSLSTLGNLLTSDLSPKKGVYRDAAKDIYEEVYQSIADKDLNIVLDSASAYAFPYASKILNVPTYSGGYDIFNRDIPFYQIVLHGYVPMSTERMMQSANPRINFLKAVETGDELLYAAIYDDASELSNSQYSYLYSSTYTLWDSNVAELIEKYGELQKKVCNSPIIGHSWLNEDVSLTEFENGTVIAVNYGQTTYEKDGLQIAACDFAVVSSESGV